MAFTYKWSDLLELVKKQVKNIPTQPIDALQCDWVSGLIAEKLPWKTLQQTIAPGQIPLVDGQQDYDPPFNISKLSEASLCRTSDTPGEDISLNVLDSLARDPRRRSVYAITSIALQAGEGKLRLVSAVAIPVNQTWELRGQYEINPTKVISTSQGLWFDDKYVHLAIEGLKYCYFQMADDPRAGTVSATGLGDSQYTGQIATFVSALKRMADAETRNLDQIAMPDAPLGIASRQYGAMIAGYGFGFGGGTGTQIAGLVAINNDTAPMQYLVAGPGISITSSGIGSHLISFLGDGGVIVGGIQSINLSTAPVQTIVAGTGISVTTDVLTGVTTITNTAGGGGPGPAPAVTNVSPNSGPATGGTSVTITGANFGLGAIVSFATAFATNVVVVSTTSITATVPAGTPGPATVTVNVAGQTGTWASSYTYIAVPTVTGVSPNSGPTLGGTAVTITGGNFSSPATVNFGGSPAIPVTVVNATTITATTQAHATGIVAVVVTTGGQTATLNNAYTYIQPAQPIYGVVAIQVPAGTAYVDIIGGVVYLNTGDAFTQLQNTPETVGQTLGPFSPNNQCIYLLLFGGSHTFVDQNNNTFAMDPPIAVPVGGVTMYLYVSTNALYLTWTIKIAS